MVNVSQGGGGHKYLFKTLLHTNVFIFGVLTLFVYHTERWKVGQTGLTVSKGNSSSEQQSLIVIIESLIANFHTDGISVQSTALTEGDTSFCCCHRVRGWCC